MTHYRLFVAFAMFWAYPFQKFSHFVGCNFFKNSPCRSCEIFRLSRIEKQPLLMGKCPLLYLILATLASNIYHGFLNALGVSSPKIYMISWWKVFFLIKNCDQLKVSGGSYHIKRVKMI